MTVWIGVVTKPLPAIDLPLGEALVKALWLLHSIRWIPEFLAADQQNN
jgi:hypothetical protein